MRWEGRRQSGNIEDRRGMGPGTVAAGGAGTLILALVYMLLGGNPGDILQNSPPPSSQARRGAAQNSPEDQKMKEFVAVTLADTEDVWNTEFKRNGATYREPKLVLFTGMVQSACGNASSAVGPFYCGGDQTVYIDLSFYEELKRRFGAPGDFAQAYVIAHEVGHHVQNQLGVMNKINNLRSRAGEAEANRLSVRLELQADYLAGVWAHHAKEMAQIDRGDIEEAIRAASAIGDDKLQQESQGVVVPESFTHGSSEQRMAAFTAGWKSGDLRQAMEYVNVGR